MMRGSPKKTVPASAPAYNELMGFEVFRPNRLQEKTNVIGLYITSQLIRMTKAAIEALGNPAFILIFFDEMSRRMMFQPADSKSTNAVQLRVKSNAKNEHVARTIQRPLVVREIEKISGIKIAGKFWLPGHAAETVTPSLIFDLKDLEERRTR